MILKEIITYYVNHQTPAFCIFLDMSKAFDGLHYIKLIKLLYKRDLPAEILRLKVALYAHNIIPISWHGVMSECVMATNMGSNREQR